MSPWRRFPTAPTLMAFTGLIPSEHSSGAKRARGPITKTGNAHLRRVLVEAADGPSVRNLARMRFRPADLIMLNLVQAARAGATAE